jgi:hypothetical protein
MIVDMFPPTDSAKKAFDVFPTTDNVKDINPPRSLQIVTGLFLPRLKLFI